MGGCHRGGQDVGFFDYGGVLAESAVARRHLGDGVFLDVELEGRVQDPNGCSRCRSKTMMYVGLGVNDGFE